MIEHPSLDTPTSGSIRFNTDTSRLELYRGNEWVEIDSTSPEEQIGGARALFGGGATPSDEVDTIDFVNIASTTSLSPFTTLKTPSGRPAS